MSLKLLGTIITTILAIGLLNAQQTYKYEIDIATLKKDRVKVVLTPPKLSTNNALFVMPMVIPGSYSKKDYGRFIKKVKAFDANGKKLKIKRENINDFVINGAQNLSKIEFWADDTWDDKKKKQFVFQPGGSNFEANQNFVLNSHAFLGYFEGMQQMPFEITVKHQPQMYGGTPLYVQSINSTTDIILADSYNELVDNPIMYSQPDTASFMAGKTQIVVVNYSPNKVVTARQIANYVKPLGKALEQFFGELPVDKYYFICYWADPSQEVKQKTAGLGGYGALEHNKSSFYYLPEIKNEIRVESLMQDIGAHEFLHILTPLNIRSEEISFFNFRNPKMSRHLWMYEGITEYFSWLVRVQNNLITQQEFLHEMRLKILKSRDYGEFSFTEMSQNVLTETNQNRYLDVYQGGALIGFALDIELLSWSNGTYGLKNLMLDLADKYGPDKPFKDANLIDEIIEMTSEEMRPFFTKHVIGNEPINYHHHVQKIGWEYKGDIETTVPYFGNFSFRLSEDEDQAYFMNVGRNLLGVKSGTELLSVNNIDLSVNIDSIIELVLYPKDFETMTFKVVQDDIIQTIKAEPVSAPVKEFAVLLAMEKPNEQQLTLRNKLLTGKGIID